MFPTKSKFDLSHVSKSLPCPTKFLSSTLSNYHSTNVLSWFKSLIVPESKEIERPRSPSVPRHKFPTFSNSISHNQGLGPI